jgi:hypothetical protein
MLICLLPLFWTRPGSPTGAAQSGTVEEIEKHIATGKSAIIYFSSAPVRPDSIDSDQYSKLMAFKETLRAKRNALFEQYESLSEFRTKFARQLAQTIISKFTSAAPTTGTSIPVVAVPQPLLVPAISPAAQELLAESSMDRQGVVMTLQTLEAQWRGAVAELSKLGLLEDRMGEGEVFFVTDEGYRVADLLKQQ